jgi:hypothetical protein
VVWWCGGVVVWWCGGVVVCGVWCGVWRVLCGVWCVCVCVCVCVLCCVSCVLRGGTGNFSCVQCIVQYIEVTLSWFVSLHVISQINEWALKIIFIFVFLQINLLVSTFCV